MAALHQEEGLMGNWTGGRHLDPRPPAPRTETHTLWLMPPPSGILCPVHAKNF